MFKFLKKKRSHRFEIGLMVIFVIVGQLVFLMMSANFTRPHYEAKIYATTATEHRSEDLHKLNEAAHYFGQTMIGWSKFPHFVEDMRSYAHLPNSADLNVHMQERQNIIFTVIAPKPVTQEAVVRTKDFIQDKIDEYNSVSNTKFVLSNLDYEQLEIRKTYGFGSMLALFASLVIGVCALFVRKEFFSK